MLLRDDPPSLDLLVSQLLARVQRFVDMLVRCSQPYMRKWGSGWRRTRAATAAVHKVMGSSSVSSSEAGGRFSADHHPPPHRSSTLPDTDGQPHALKNGVQPLQQQQAAAALTTDRGFVHSDWALVFMLRMGLLSVQMMQQRSLANIGLYYAYKI